MAGESAFFWIYTIKRHQGTLKYSVIYKIITHEHISARKLRSYEDIRREKWIFFDNFSTVSENITYCPGGGELFANYSPHYPPRGLKTADINTSGGRRP